MNKFLRTTPFFLLTLALCIGIFIAWCGAPLSTVIIFLSLGLLLCPLWWLLNSKYKSNLRSIWTIGIVFIIIALGQFLMHNFLQRSKWPFNSEPALYSIQIKEVPIEKEKSIQLHAALLERYDSLEIHSISNKNIIIYLQKDSASSKLSKGDIIEIYTALEQPKYSQNPTSFNYAKYLTTKGICATSYVDSHSWKYISHNNNISILTIASVIQHHLLSIYKKLNISDDEFSILAALTLGYRDTLSPDIRENFSNAGAMHVLAVSGLHVGIIMLVFSIILFPLNKSKRSKQIKNIIIITLLWCYALITGLSPSVTRATIMFSLILLASILNRHSSIYNTILFSAFCILLFKPSCLFEVGFQLSYAAVLSIVYFEPQISNLLRPTNHFLKWLWELLCVSLTAQLGTLPFTLFYFHQFPNYFLLTNFIVIPFASLIIYVTIILLCTSWIPFIGTSIALALNYILKAFYWSISTIDSFPYTVSHIWINEYEALLLFLLIISLVFCIEYKNFKSYISTLTLLLILSCIHSYNHYQSFTQQHIFIFNSNKTNLICYISGRENYTISSDSIQATELAEDLWIKELTVPYVFKSDTILHNTAYVVNGERYLCLTHSLPHSWKYEAPLNVEHLIIGNKIYPDSLLFQNIHTKDIVITKNVPKYAVKRIRDIALSCNIPIRE